VLNQSAALSAEGTSISRQRDLRERKNLPASVLTQMLRVGEAVAVGSLDGGLTQPGVFCFKVPPPDLPPRPE
jgi:hypothetical protein